MNQPLYDTLSLFGFTQMRSWIVLVCMLVFLGNLLGGMLYSISRAYLGAITPRALSERLSFRLFLLSELLLVVFVFYYHAVIVGNITPGHVLFWVSAMVITPLLAIIGSQSMYLVLSGQINKNLQAGKKRRGRKPPSSGSAQPEEDSLRNPAEDFLRAKRKS